MSMRTKLSLGAFRANLYRYTSEKYLEKDSHDDYFLQAKTEAIDMVVEWPIFSIIIWFLSCFLFVRKSIDVPTWRPDTVDHPQNDAHPKNADHIRNKNDYIQISEYKRNNPKKWRTDKFNK